MSFLLNTLASLREQRLAIARAEGLPRRATVVGGPDYLPRSFARGAPGWTAHLCPAPRDAGDGTGALRVPPEARKHLGKRVRVDGADVDVQLESELVEENALPVRYRNRVEGE